MNKFFKLSTYEEDGKVYFGWQEFSYDDSTIEKYNLDCENNDLIKMSDIEDPKKEISYYKKEDLMQYINMSFGLTCIDISNRWSDNISLFEDYLLDSVISYKKGDGEYLVNLSRLCLEGVGFYHKTNKIEVA